MRPRATLSPEVESAIQQARIMARAIGQEEELGKIVDLAFEYDFQGLDKILEKLLPDPTDLNGGFETAFLPSFAMTATAPLMRDRASWRGLRDRLFTMMEHLVKEHRDDASIQRISAVWREQFAQYATEQSDREN